MSETEETIKQALSGKDIDWAQYGDVSDFDPSEGVVSKRGRKPKGQREVDEDSPLHNAPKAELEIQTEKTEHRFMVFLFAQGKSVKQVFMSLGGKWDEENGRPFPVKSHGGQYSYAHITQIRRQPWFQKEVVELMHSQGEDVVAAAFQNEWENNVSTICEIRDNKEEKGSTRLNAANSLLDRFLGKPTQHVKADVTSKSLGEIAKDKGRLDKELEIIEAEIVAMNPEPVREIQQHE